MREISKIISEVSRKISKISRNTSDTFEKYFGKFQRINSKNSSEIFKKFWELYWKIKIIVSKKFEINFGKFNTSDIFEKCFEKFRESFWKIFTVKNHPQNWGTVGWRSPGIPVWHEEAPMGQSKHHWARVAGEAGCTP